MTPSPVVIVGAGSAGNSAAFTLRREGYVGPIVMIDARSPTASWAAPHAAHRSAPAYAPSAYVAASIEIRRGDRAVFLDVGRRRVILDSGNAVGFGRLIIATGVPSVLADAAVFRGVRIVDFRCRGHRAAVVAAARSSHDAAIVGADLEILELASSLCALGTRVTIVASAPLEATFGNALGGFLRAHHEQHGVRFVRGTVKSIDRSGLTLRDGTPVSADLVVATRQAKALQGAAVPVFSGAQVPVNANLEVCGGVYAVGTVAQPPAASRGPLIPGQHWAFAHLQGETVARNIVREVAGMPPEQFAARPLSWTCHHNAALGIVGQLTGWQSYEVDGPLSPAGGAVTYYRADAAVAVATIHAPMRSLAGVPAFRDGVP